MTEEEEFNEAVKRIEENKELKPEEREMMLKEIREAHQRYLEATGAIDKDAEISPEFKRKFRL